MGLRVWMEARSLRFIATACAGEQLSGSPETRVHRVSTDSRQVQVGDLFFALPGGRFDGHDFLRQASEKGAGAVVVERRRVPAGWSGCAMVVVENTRKALGQLASKYREDFALPLVAVGGSNGKTTTKELVASVLRQKVATLWSEASFNNDIGVPLTLVGGAAQAAQRLVVVAADRLVADIPTGHHQRSPDLGHQQVVQRRCGQHETHLVETSDH